MVVAIALFDFHLPVCRGLKEKRAFLRPLKTRLRGDFGISAAEVARYLRQPDRTALGLCGAGDIQRGYGDNQGAEARYRQVCDDPAMPTGRRAMARLKLAEVLRLAGATLADVTDIAVARDPLANLPAKAAFAAPAAPK